MRYSKRNFLLTRAQHMTATDDCPMKCQVPATLGYTYRKTYHCFQGACTLVVLLPNNAKKYVTYSATGQKKYVVIKIVF